MKQIIKYLHTRSYKELLEKYGNMVSTLQKMNRQGFKDEIIQNKYNELINDYRKAKENEKTSLRRKTEANLAQIKKVLANPPKSYQNPVEEQLKRQDFDIKLELMSRNDVIDLLKSGAVFSEYELNKMRLAFKDSPEIKVLTDNLAESADKPYLASDDYIANTKVLNNINLLFNMPKFWLNDSETIDTPEGLHEILAIENNFIEEAKKIKPRYNKADEYMIKKNFEQERKGNNLRPSMFRESTNYDGVERLEYLIDMFPDIAKGYDLTDPNTDFMQLANQLENKHEEYLTKNETYRQHYEMMAKQVKANNS